MGTSGLPRSLHSPQVAPAAQIYFGLYNDRGSTDRLGNRAAIQRKLPDARGCILGVVVARVRHSARASAERSVRAIIILFDMPDAWRLCTRRALLPQLTRMFGGFFDAKYS